MTKVIILLMIVEYFGGLYPNQQEKSESYVSVVIEECKKEDVDPLIMATIFRFESGWRSYRIGKRGEIGLGQVLKIPKKQRAYVLKHPRIQIQKSIIVFKEKYRQCKGNLLKSFNAYMSGRCNVSKKAKLRYRYYRRFRRLEKIYGN